jgi:signal transduction histidine kinase
VIVFWGRFKHIFSSLRARLALVVAVSFVPAVLAILHDHIGREQQELLEASRQAEVSVRVAAETYEGRFESARQVLIALSQVEKIQSGDRKSCERTLAKYLTNYPHLDNLGVAKADGSLWASALPFTGPTHVGDRAYFQRVMESGRFSVGDYQSGRFTKDPTIVCAQPIVNSEGKIDRVVFVAFDLQFLSPLIDDRVYHMGARLALVDRNGTVLGSSQSSDLGQTHPFSGGDSLPGSVASFRSGDRLCSIAPVRTRPLSGLRVIMDIHLDDLFRMARWRLYKNLGWLAFSLLIAAALCGRVGGYFITRHVHSLLATTGQLRAGNLSARTGIGVQSGELADLARAIDTMAEGLERRNKELEEARQNLENKVELRTRELEEANRQLESFGFSISHDLRAPLRAIDGFSQILLNEHASSLLPEGRRILGLVVKNSKHMAQLIDDLLAFSRLGRQEVVGIELNMGEMAREVYQDLTTPPLPRSIDVTIRPMPNARGDNAMVRQVWTNLIENALKYTSRLPHAVIEIGVEMINGETAYFVKDNGVGFDPHFAGKLFQVFQRLHGSSQFAGTGVGLAIVHRIVLKHGGRVWAESRPQEGATFYFSLRTPPL